MAQCDTNGQHAVRHRGLKAYESGCFRIDMDGVVVFRSTGVSLDALLIDNLGGGEELVADL